MKINKKINGSRKFKIIESVLEEKWNYNLRIINTEEFQTLEFNFRTKSYKYEFNFFIKDNEIDIVAVIWEYNDEQNIIGCEHLTEEEIKYQLPKTLELINKFK